VARAAHAQSEDHPALGNIGIEVKQDAASSAVIRQPRIRYCYWSGGARDGHSIDPPSAPAFEACLLRVSGADLA
jgi:hypothetical protein